MSMSVTAESQYLKSTFYEQLTEHVFVSEVLQEAWFGFGRTVEVLRSEIDASGYDLVLECAGVTRHVQLKTSKPKAKTSYQKVHVSLAEKPSGCVVWLIRQRDEEERRLGLSYRFFGGAPGKALPSLQGFSVAKHTKADSTGVKAERPNIRRIPRGQFREVETTAELVAILFGLAESD